MKFALVIAIKTGEISFRIENNQISLGYDIRKTLQINSFVNFNKSLKKLELINENEFDHTVHIITNEMLIELNNFKLKSTEKGDSTLQMNSSTQVVVEQKDIDGEQEDSGVDAFDILAEVIQENKPRIMSEQEPEVLKITDYLKK
ncbi:unnamed protein product [Rotaria sordida]|uniref:Uncharacterized protein n=1 Tax=Rotaria sordida TaxID=392033 RepID=A0A814S7J6_9BILA|nr:unnamed protein product [Rotaria sordida]